MYVFLCMRERACECVFVCVLPFQTQMALAQFGMELPDSR